MSPCDASTNTPCSGCGSTAYHTFELREGGYMRCNECPPDAAGWKAPEKRGPYDWGANGEFHPVGLAIADWRSLPWWRRWWELLTDWRVK